MNYNDAIAKGIDFLVLDQQDEADLAFQKVIVSLKAELKDTKDRNKKIELNLWWARTLELMEEYEQALIRYQKALEIDYSNREILYRIASLFVHSLSKPQHAIPLLEEKLLKWDPENEEYQDLLDHAKNGIADEDTEVIEID